MIPNIVKGKGITGSLAYMMGQGNDKLTGERIELEEGETSRAEILGGQNFGFEITGAAQLELARKIMEYNGMPAHQASRGRKCEKDCLHASLSWEPGYDPSKEEMIEAGKGLLKSLGMETAQAVFIAHTDTEHKHIHIVASRIDPNTGKTYSEVDDYINAQRWALKWERDHDQIPECEQRRALHRTVDAITIKDTATVLDNLTQRSPTFTARELDTVLKYGQLPKDERTKFRDEILGSKNGL
jgi:Relaxase/Mobilisation nuclease domain